MVFRLCWWYVFKCQSFWHWQLAHWKVFILIIVLCGQGIWQEEIQGQLVDKNESKTHKTLVFAQWTVGWSLISNLCKERYSAVRELSAMKCNFCGVFKSWPCEIFCLVFCQNRFCFKFLIKDWSKNNGAGCHLVLGWQHKQNLSK